MLLKAELESGVHPLGEHGRRQQSETCVMSLTELSWSGWSHGENVWERPLETVTRRPTCELEVRRGYRSIQSSLCHWRSSAGFVSLRHVVWVEGSKLQPVQAVSDTPSQNTVTGSGMSIYLQPEPVKCKTLVQVSDKNSPPPEETLSLPQDVGGVLWRPCCQPIGGPWIVGGACVGGQRRTNRIQS